MVEHEVRIEAVLLGGDDVKLRDEAVDLSLVATRQLLHYSVLWKHASDHLCSGKEGLESFVSERSHLNKFKKCFL